MNKTMQQLNFSISNLGSVRSGKFCQRPLTILCGPNNSGKTWAMYSLYHCHKWLQFFAEKAQDANEHSSLPSLRNFNRKVSSTLDDLFNSPPKILQNAKFQLLMEEQASNQLIKSRQDYDTFLMPAERNGLHLFYRELSNRRTALLHHASREKINLQELLKDVIGSRYAIPIAHYIDWLNSLPEIQRNANDHFDGLVKDLQRKLTGGVYNVNKEGDISFKPYQLKRDGIPTQKMGLHMTSSTVKSLFGLWFYLKNQARPDDLLMIDEPELNLHPDNQRSVARMLARMVNAGINIVIRTHSDYIIREFNTLLMLHSADQALLRKYKYQPEETLNLDKVSAHLFDDQTIQPLAITADDGIHATTFDTVISDLNDINDTIYYELQELKQKQEQEQQA